MYYLLYILYLHRFADFAFYQNGLSLFIVSFLGFFALVYFLLNRYNFNKVFLLQSSIFFFILLFLNIAISKNIADSFIYIVLLISLVFLFFYLIIKGVAFKFLDTLFLIGLINIVFVIIEAFLKLKGYFNLEIIPFSFYINDRFNLGGIFYQPSLNALFLNSTALISLYHLFYNKKPFYRKVFFITIYVISVILSIYTGSRASMLAMCIAIVLFFTIATFKGFDFGFRNRLVLIFCIYLALLVVNRFLPFDAAFQSPLTKFHVQGSEDFSIISRFNIWFSQILIFLDNPFFGVGLDNFKYINTPYQLESIRLLNLPYNAIGNFTFGHNEFLQLLCEGGLFLIIPLLYISFKALKKAINNINEKNVFLYLIVVIFIIQSMFSWPLRHPVLMLYFVVVIACLTTRIEGFYSSTPFLKNINYIFLSLFFIIYITFFISFGKAIALELYYIPKAKSSTNFFHSLTYIDKLSKNPYLKYGANHLFVQKAFNYLWQDIFNSPFVPVTRELYRKVNREKLFHYDKRALLDTTYRKAKLLYNLRLFWYYPFVISFIELIHGDYNSSYKYAKEAENLKPNDESIFALMHFANVLKASKLTGKPVSEILPSKEDIKALQESFRKSTKTK